MAAYIKYIINNSVLLPCSISILLPGVEASLQDLIWALQSVSCQSPVITHQLLTGEPGLGKTTALLQIRERVGQCPGIYAHSQLVACKRLIGE